MVVWVGDGEFSVFDAPSGILAMEGLLVGPNGTTLDTQFITRLQYPGGHAPQEQITARATFDFNGTETGFPNTTGWGRRAGMFVVPASAFAPGYIPTCEEIRLNLATRVFRGTITGGSTNNVAEITIYGPTAASLDPNTKYWAMIMTTWSKASSTPSIANDAPLTIAPANTIGRAVSFWTNRTPNKPVIGTNQSVYAPGSNIVLNWNISDPDEYGGGGTVAYSDLAGIQIQYAARPTPDNPAPPWQDMLFRDASGTGKAWWIRGTTNPEANAEDLMASNGVFIQAGEDAPTTNPRCSLPGGTWQIRMRVMDQGNAYAPGGPIYGASTNTYTPDTYPATNISPWSDPITVTIPVQVPPPIPLSPKNRVAITEGTPVTLSWQYRNNADPPDPIRLYAGASWDPGDPPITSLTIYSTYESYPRDTVLRFPSGQLIKVWGVVGVPSPTPGATLELVTYPFEPIASVTAGTYLVAGAFPQGTRTIQMRERGEADWTTVVNAQATDSAEWEVDGYLLSAGHEYQWRVKVTDWEGEASQYSDIASFWIVPQPQSGPMIPSLDDSLDAGSLGCGKNRAFIYKRGGKIKVAEITGLTYLDWARVRDEISTARVVVSDWDLDCGNLLSKLESWAYELVIFRDTGFSNDRVWEGPITLLTYETDSVTIEAKDVMAYAYRRILKQEMKGTEFDTVVTRAAQVLQNSLAEDDPNLLAYLNVIANTEDATAQYRSVPAYARTAYEEVDDMAANAGLDYTAIGRSIVLWGTRSRIGLLPQLIDKDLGAAVIVSEYGMNMANRYVVSDGNGVWGEATRLDGDGEDPHYGLVEMLSSTWADDSSETGEFNESAAEKTAIKFAEYAERSISDRYPNPVVVRIPDNTSLNPAVQISIKHLVPGITIPLRSTATLRTVVANQKLDSVKVVEQGGKETVSITLSPFAADDRQMEAEE